MAELIKVDRNGSKHWRGKVQCDRCGGHGYYAIGVCNGKPVLSPLDSGVCWKCLGAGTVIETWIERTPETAKERLQGAFQRVLEKRKTEDD